MARPLLPSGGRVGRAIFVVLLPLAVACSSEPNAESAIERDAQALRDLTLPPASKSLEVSSAERVNSTVRVSWVFETTQTWEEYARWVADRFAKQGHFTQGPESRDSLDFISELPGDTHVVRIDLVRQGPPAFVRVTLRAWAS